MKTQQLQLGDNFTIEGIYDGTKGQTIIDGRNIATGRKCQGVKLKLFIFTSKESHPKSIESDYLKYFVDNLKN